MIEVAATAKAVIVMLVTMAAHGTLLALLALVITQVGRAKLRPSWQAAVWLVVLAKFALPWGPALPWSLADALASLSDRGGATPLVLTTGEHAVAVTSGSLTSAVGWLALATVWLAGTAFVLIRAIDAQRAASRAARAAAPAPAAARTLLATLAATLRIRAPRLVVGAPDVGPHVVGLFRPIIVVPPALVSDDVAPLLRAALLHELAHVRRKDALGRAIQLAATAVFFFWPVVRLAGKRLDHAREAACDAWALEAGDLPRPAYARLLVRMAQLRAAAAPGLAAHALDARVRAVLGPPARAKLGVLHAIALVAWIALSLGGARTAEARGEIVCTYTPRLAEALRVAHPEADLDGDGVLSRGEACELQAELRRRVETDPQVSILDTSSEELLAEPLCCNCEPPGGQLGPWAPADQSCQEGSTP